MFLPFLPIRDTKEDAVAKTMFEEIARRVGRNTVVAADIHWNALNDKDITTIITICRELTDKIVTRSSDSSSRV
jgi:hypothetical protein